MRLTARERHLAFDLVGAVLIEHGGERFGCLLFARRVVGTVRLRQRDTLLDQARMP